MIVRRDLRKFIFKKISLYVGREWIGRGKFVLEGELGIWIREAVKGIKEVELER